MNLEVKYDAEVKMFVVYLDGARLMKNKKQSTLYMTLSKWLKSQNK